MSISNLGKTSSAFDKLFSAFSSGNYADFESASNSILSVSIETIAAVAKTKNLTAAQTALALATRGASKEQIAQNLALRGFSKEIVSKTMSNTLGYSDEMIEAAFAADSVASAFGKVGESGSAAVTKIGDVFSGLGGILKKSLPLLAAISIAIGAIKLTDWAITTPEEANENMATQFSEYEAANSEVESLNSELETTNVRIKELQAKGGLTLLENGELENLKEAATLLKVQKDLAERKAESEGREAAESALDAYRTNFFTPISAETTDLFKSTSGLTDWGNGNFDSALFTNDRNVSAQIAGLQLLKEELADMDVGTEEWDNCNDKITEVTDNIWDQASELANYKSRLEAIPESLRTDEQNQAIQDITDSIGYIYQTLDPATWKDMQLDNILSKDVFSSAKEGLVEMAKASDNAGVSAQYVKDNYKQLVRELEAAGISVEDFVGEINSEAGIVDYNAVKSQLKDGLNGSSIEKDDFSTWIDNLSEDDLELVYSISVDTDTAKYTLADWQDAINYYKENTSDLPDIELEKSGIESVTSALSEASSATGLTSESINNLKDRYEDLEGFNADALFENTATGVRLNSNYLAALGREITLNIKTSEYICSSLNYICQILHNNLAIIKKV